MGGCSWDQILQSPICKFWLNHPIDASNGGKITEAMAEFAKRLDVDLQQRVIGLACDAGSSGTGETIGVKGRMKEKAPNAKMATCDLHLLSLAVANGMRHFINHELFFSPVQSAHLFALAIC